MKTEDYNAIEWFAYCDLREFGYNPYDTSPYYMTAYREVAQNICNNWI